ncbi:28463_t:CDS:1, partial [Racocetra persica]
TIKVINDSFKRNISDKKTDEFKKLLDNNRKNLIRLNNTIGKIAHHLTNIIQENDKSKLDIIVNLNLKNRLKNKKLRLFDNKYKIFEIDDSIWEGKPFSMPDEIEKAIVSLNNNFKKLNAELETQTQNTL